MSEVVRAVEEAFRSQANGSAVNTPRSRSVVPGAWLNAMHASIPELGRSGAKMYLTTRLGTKFMILLFDNRSGEVLSVMGADQLGRFRTGAASAVATKHLSGLKSFRLALAGSGHQALTQVLSQKEVAQLEHVSVWSPTREKREALAAELRDRGLDASAAESVAQAFKGAEVGTAVTAATEPFLTSEVLRDIRHVNLCGSNAPNHAEIVADAVGLFGTVCVDDLAQSMAEAGDLVRAVDRGALGWENVRELKDFLTGKAKPSGRTLFKSNGVALEDVAVASLVYDKALRSPERYATTYEFGR